MGSPEPKRSRGKGNTRAPTPVRRRPAVSDADPEAARELRVSRDGPEGEQPAARDETAIGHVLGERGEAEEARERSRHHIRPGAMPALDEALRDETVHRVADGHSCGAPAEAELALAREPVAHPRRSDELAEPRAEHVPAGILALNHRGSLGVRVATSKSGDTTWGARRISQRGPLRR